MKQELEIVKQIYQEKLINISKKVGDWWQQKVLTQAEQNNSEKNRLEHIKIQISNTMVSFTRMLKTFAEERQGRKSIIKSYISGMSSAKIIPTGDISEEARENSHEVDNFLQRVESSLGTEVYAYERMASEVIRSIQIRMKFIEENEQRQKRTIAEKTKINKDVVTSPFTFYDILTMDSLVTNEIQSRILMRKEIEEVVEILAQEEYKVYKSFRDNLDVFAKQYPAKFSNNFLYSALLTELKKLLENRELYILKYYTKNGMESLKTEQQIEEARKQYEEFKQQTTQTLGRKIDFAGVYKNYMEEIITREWKFSIPTFGDQWAACRGFMTINGVFLIFNTERESINEFDFAKLKFQKENEVTLKISQKDEKKGIMRKLIEGNKKHKETMKFDSPDDLEVFELYCKKWK